MLKAARRMPVCCGWSCRPPAGACMRARGACELLPTVLPPSASPRIRCMGTPGHLLQGGLDERLREISLAGLVARDTPGYAIGGLAGGEDKRSFVKCAGLC